MEERKQKYIIFGGVALASVIIIFFWITNYDFIMDGGFAGKQKADGTWESFKKSLSQTMATVKGGLSDAKKETPSSTESAKRVIEILKDKLVAGMASSTTSTIK